MTTWFVTRHPGAIEDAPDAGLEGRRRRHRGIARARHFGAQREKAVELMIGMADGEDGMHVHP